MAGFEPETAAPVTICYEANSQRAIGYVENLEIACLHARASITYHVDPVLWRRDRRGEEEALVVLAADAAAAGSGVEGRAQLLQQQHQVGHVGRIARRVIAPACNGLSLFLFNGLEWQRLR